MRKRYISTILLVIIMITFASEVFAANDVYMLAPGVLKAFDYSDIYDFNKFNAMYKQGYTSFKSNSDISFYRHIYWSDVFPDKSDSPKFVDFNNKSARNFNIMFYGDDRIVSPNPKDTLGNYNYMGYTKDNRNVTNIAYREDPLPKGTKVMPNPTEYIKKHGYKNARVKPFLTNYNSPRHVGELYLDNEEDIDLDFEVFLTGTDKTISTVVGLYQGDKLIETKNIAVKGNNNIDVRSTIPPIGLKKQ